MTATFASKALVRECSFSAQSSSSAPEHVEMSAEVAHQEEHLAKAMVTHATIDKDAEINQKVDWHY